MNRMKYARFMCLLLAVTVWFPIAAAQDAPGDTAARLADLLTQLRDDGAALQGGLGEALLPPKAVTILREFAQAHPSLGPEEAAQVEYFETHVRPVLAGRCFRCHGSEKQSNNLRLDSRASLLKGGDNGPVVNLDNVYESKLVHAVLREGALKMPPEDPLTGEEAEAIIHWLDMGAPWPDYAPTITTEEEFATRIADTRASHWAFRPVVKPDLPEVADAAWSRSGIDALVYHRVVQAGLQPVGPAAKSTLIRRVTYDLTGLPPTAEEVDAFLSDDSPDAYANLVDRLLASTAFGEKWARHWLDVARYSDTKGYTFQEDRNFPYSHTYRDYVIRAFNNDVPYDRFITEQLAADMLDLGEDKRPLAAMGFLTLGRRFLNNIHDIVDDRIDVTTRGFLGLTVSCARCHDHPFDPVPAADYYSLYGIFRSATEPGEYPLIEEPDPEDPEYQAFQAAVAERTSELQNHLAERHFETLSHAREKIAEYLHATVEAWDIAEDDAFRKLAKDRELHWQLMERWRAYLKDQVDTNHPVFGPFKEFMAARETFAESAPEIAARVSKNETAVRPVNPLVAKAFEGDAPADMAAVVTRYATLLLDADKRWRDRLATQTLLAAHGQTPAFPEALPDANWEALRQTLYAKDMPVNIPQGQVREYLDIPQRDAITRLENRLQNVQATHPGRPDRAMALTDLAQLFDPYVFQRGKPGARGEDVPRRFLAILSEGERKPFENGSGRLELAQAIADPENPLTARVFVNRVWAKLFDTPLVGTTSDFGLRSDLPTHPKLLDYLAATFVENGWSMKNLIRTIVLSEAYRMRSDGTPEQFARDPENTLLSHQNRSRLDFEGMRDSLLATAGNLDTTVGGESIDILREPYSTRRTVYAQVERQNLPGLFRTFDFASPDAHSPGRFETTVPQQALFMMNSPFVVGQARRVLNRAEEQAEAPEARVDALYDFILQRAPSPEETALALDFVNSLGGPQAPDIVNESPWHYGYGHVDEETETVDEFTPLPKFVGKEWRGGDTHPDPELGWVALNFRGGHPGKDAHFASIRRWVSPVTAEVSIGGVLRHEQEKGDGIKGYIVSSRHGILWSGTSHNEHPLTRVESTLVEKGDTIDFVVACRENEGYDSYLWSPRIRIIDTVTTGGLDRVTQLEWDTRTGFQGPQPPPPPPLEPWEAYAQVLLMTNEFAFVD